jgi:PAS domain S-box-containing protein
MAEFKFDPEVKQPFPRKLAAIFLLFSVIIVILGIYYYRYEKARIFKEQEISLSAIASLKIKQISQWYSDKLADAVLIKDNEPLVDRIKEFLKDENQTGLRKEITVWLEALNSQYDYNSVAVLDTLLRVRLATSNNDPLEDDSIRKELNNVIRYHKIRMTDLHKTGPGQSIRMDLLVPLLDPLSKEQKSIGLIILCIDPGKILFPLVQSWPTPSKSSETLVLRREGDSVVYLNELRNRKNSSLNLKFPLSNNKLLASKAVNGFEGVTEGVDYRNVPVIGSISKIEGLPWYMVAKTDKKEILAPFKRYSVITITVVILLMLINGCVFGFWIWQQRIKSFKNLLKSEISIRELEERFTTAFRMSPVSVTISSIHDNKFIDINNTFLNDMGYTREEVIGRTPRELDIWADENERLWIIKEISEKGKIFGKIISYKTKAGDIIYGLSSMSVVTVNGEPCNLSTAVNITESRKAEEKLKESEELFRKLFENMLNGFAYCQMLNTDGDPLDFIYLEVNEAFGSLTGLKDVKGKKVSEVIPGIQQADPELLERYSRVATTGKPDVFEVWVEALKMWFSISVYSPQKGYFVAVFDVITLRKNAEKALRISEERYRNIFNSLIEGFCIIEMIFDTEKRPVDYRFLETNSSFENQTGLHDVKGKLMTEIAPENEQFWYDIYGQVALTGEPVRFENEAKALNRWFEVRATKVDGLQNQNVAIYFNDITERKNSEAALRESEDKFKYIFDHSVVGKSITLPTGEIQVNNAFCEMLGYSHDELKSKKWKEISHPDDVELSQKEMDALVRGEKDSSRFYKRYLHKNGDIVWTDVRTAVRRDENNKAVYFMTAIIDITERKKAEDALRESEDKFKYIFEHSVMGNSISLPNGEVHFNKAFCEILGYTDEELRKMKWPEFTHPDDFKITQKVIDSIVSRESESPRFIKRYIRKDGSTVWADVSTSLRRDENGNGVYFMTTINDITDLKLAEEVLRNDEKRFRELIDALPQLYWTCRVDGPCDYLSKQWVEYTGIPEAEQLDYRWLEQLHPDDRAKTISEWTEKVKTFDNFDIEFRIRRFDGEYHWFKTRAVPIRNSEDQIVRWLGSNTDIDAIRKAEAQLINYSKDLEKSVALRTEQLEAANKELEAFSYSVSHDLRAPLRSVHGFTKILLEDYEAKLDDEGKRICRIITSSATQMGELIDDLLSFSRIGRSSLNPSEIDMKKMAKVVFEGITSPTERKRIKLKIGNLSNAYGDVTLFGQVWTNLISNAIKYSSKEDFPEITIGSKADRESVTYFIKDNGVGFDMKFAHKLFGVFQRLHSESEFEGNGVGLAIVQRIILKHDGKVWAEGALGKGATFFFSLPVLVTDKKAHETRLTAHG